MVSMPVGQVANDVRILGNHAHYAPASGGYTFSSLTHRGRNATRIEPGERRTSDLREVTISMIDQRQEKQNGKPWPATPPPFKPFADGPTSEQQVYRKDDQQPGQAWAGESQNQNSSEPLNKQEQRSRLISQAISAHQTGRER